MLTLRRVSSKTYDNVCWQRVAGEKLASIAFFAACEHAGEKTILLWTACCLRACKTTQQLQDRTASCGRSSDGLVHWCAHMSWNWTATWAASVFSKNSDCRCGQGLMCGFHVTSRLFQHVLHKDALGHLQRHTVYRTLCTPYYIYGILSTKNLHSSDRILCTMYHRLYTLDHIYIYI